MDIRTFQAAKKSVRLPQGEIAYADIGEGPAALFVHGVFMNGLLWRNAIAELSSQRRCIAIDLPAHGDTHVSLDSGFSLEEHAKLLVDFLDALGVDRVDLVGNDTGGAICQLFAVQNRARVRTLTLTNCDVHDNYPPDAFKDSIELARQGQLAPLIIEVTKDLELARSEDGLGVGYEHSDKITEEMVQAYLGRYTDEEAGREIERRIAAVAEGDLRKIEGELKRFTVPTLVVWGTADKFFATEWAYWLRDTIPGVTEVVEIEGGKLFFPDERGQEFASHLSRLWTSHSEESATTGAGREA